MLYPKTLFLQKTLGFKTRPIVHFYVTLTNGKKQKTPKWGFFASQGYELATFGLDQRIQISLCKSYGDLLLQIFQHSFYTLTNLLLSFSFLQCYKRLLIFFPVSSLSPEFLQLSKQSKKEHRFSWNLIFDSVKAENLF